MNFGKQFVLFSAVTFLVFSGMARGSVITPGPGAFPPDIFNLPGTTLLASNTVSGMDSTGTLSFTVTSAVFSDPGNTFGANDLDFVYQVANSANSMDSIGRITAINFTGFSTDVGYDITGSTLPGGAFVDGSVAPQLVDRVSADVVGFSFSAPLTFLIAPGQTSNALVIETNATSFTAGFLNLVDGGVSTVNAYEPTIATVPDTLSLVWVAITFAAVLVFRPRKTLA